MIPSIWSSWPKPIMENLKVMLNTQKLAEHRHFEKQSASFYCASSPQRVKAATLSLGPGQKAYSGNFQVPGNMQKNWLILAISNSNLLHVTVHHPSKFETDTWNPLRVTAVASSIRSGKKRRSWKISKFRGTLKYLLIMAILHSDLLHGTVHHPTKF